MTDFTTIQTEPKRDGWGRPLITPPDGGKAVAYTRCTTFVDVLEDKYTLQKWMQRMVAVGIGTRQDLHLSAASLAADPEGNKRSLDQLCERAMEAARASAKATIGTALHSYIEQINLGTEPVGVPEEFKPHVEAYRRIAAPLLTPHLVERFTVNDELKIGGTPDLIAGIAGEEGRFVCDLKGLALDTPIPTPHGWTTMGEAEVGDIVFDAYGKQCKVTAKSSVKKIGTYVVRFDDGSEITCDAEHIWWTNASHDTKAEPTPKPIQEVMETLTKYGQNCHRVPVAGALDLPERALPIDPYLLGCWLGDGNRGRGVITKTADLFTILEEDGHCLGKPYAKPGSPHVITRTVLGLEPALRGLGVLTERGRSTRASGYKHIPMQYLRASTDQRLKLLQGLMDTDGTWNRTRRTAVFNSTSETLARGVAELMSSLGQRPYVTKVNTEGFGAQATSWSVEITPVGINPFRLPRKAALAARSEKSTTKASRRVITSITPGPDIETACIAVDSPTHTYLCGRQMIPTHNTGPATLTYGSLKVAMQMAVYAHSHLYDPATGQRSPIDARTDKGLVIALNSETAECTLHWVDLTAGWEAVQVAAQVRQWRARKGLVADYTPPAPAVQVVEQPKTPKEKNLRAAILDAIREAETYEALTDLWDRAQGHWDDGLTEAVKSRLKAIQA